ncbi:venom peptide BmKAPI-like [Centruroides sculpturatus]|uniref:venom peptide BmKAPI-like n=1 Tax=Centruroides sculpturatus TaxID=218467 RepID=UPI000C6CDB14|nr:venom peptide BmKAPI-like [Centruroides sculpturatus]XP_023239390.1 venom peptide BmKAPI-like [Centruroides sculpturatus]
MKTYIATIICIFFLCFSQDSAQPLICDEGQELIDCITPCGPRRCSTYLENTIHPERCASILLPLCTIGCQCKDGKFLNDEGECVELINCSLDFSDI